MKPAGFHAQILVLLLAAAAALGTNAEAQPGPDRWHAAAAVASDYVLHGLSQLDAGPALHLSFDFEHETGLFAGAALANVDYEFETGFSQGRDSQLTFYSGYVWRRGPWAANATLSRYVYPDSPRDYDYTQLAVTASFRERYFLTAARSNDYLAVYSASGYVRAGIALPWVHGLAFEFNAGRFTTDSAYAESYDFWDVGLSRAVGRFALDLRFHDNSFGRASLLGNANQNMWVLSMSYPLLPRSRGRR